MSPEKFKGMAQAFLAANEKAAACPLTADGKRLNGNVMHGALRSLRAALVKLGFSEERARVLSLNWERNATERHAPR